MTNINTKPMVTWNNVNKNSSKKPEKKDQSLANKLNFKLGRSDYGHPMFVNGFNSTHK